MAADVTITVGADVSQLESAVRDGEKAIKRLDAAADRLGRSMPAASSSLERIDAKAKALNKTGQLLGGTFGQIGGSLDDLNDLLQMGELRMAAVVGAVGGLALGVGALGREVLTTTANIDAMFKSLDADRQKVISDAAMRLQVASAEMDNAGQAATALRIAFAGLFSETTGTGARALANGVDVVTSAINKIESSGALSRLREFVALGAAAGLFGMPANVASLLGLGVSTLAGSTPSRPFFETFPAGGAASDIGVPAGIARVDGATGSRGVTSANAPRDVAFDFSQGASDVEIGPSRDDIAAEFAFRAELAKKHYEEVLAAKERHNAEMEAADKAFMEQQRRDAVEVLGASMAFADSVFGLVQQSLSATGEATRAEQERAFENQKDAAQAQALVSWGLATANIIASMSGTGPAAIATVALGVAAVTAGMATALAQIEAQEFTPRHRGGMVDPDEYPVAGGILARKNEGIAVFTRQGIDAVGGQQGLTALNAGVAPRVPDIYLVVDGEPRRARELARPVPGYGQPVRRTNGY